MKDLLINTCHTERSRRLDSFYRVLKLNLLLLTLFLLPQTTQAQYFNVFDIDKSDYPTMKAKFYSIDDNGKQILNHTPADFEITENGEKIEPSNVSYKNKSETPYSVLLAIDVLSLTNEESEKRIKEQANYWISNMPDNGSESTIIGFHKTNNAGHLLTTNKDTLYKLIKNTKPYSRAINYNAAFIEPPYGAKFILQDTKYFNRAVILLTDGQGSDHNTQKIINEMNKLGIRVFILAPKNYVPMFDQVSQATFGKHFRVDTFEESKTALDEINDMLNLTQSEIEWKSLYNCELTKDINIFNNENKENTTQSYEINKNQTANMTVRPSFINFGKVTPGESIDTAITIKSDNIDLIIEDIIFEYGSNVYTINEELPINLEKNIEKEISFTYKPIDSVKSYTSYTIHTNKCESEINFLGGYFYQDTLKHTVDILTPKKGEIYYAGESKTIEWNELSNNYQYYEIDFSTDNGNNFKKITDSAENGNYNWVIPNEGCNECLVSISPILPYEDRGVKLEFSSIAGDIENDRGNEVIQLRNGNYVVTGSINDNLAVINFDKKGDINWQKTYGGSNEESGYSIKQTLDGGFVTVGTTNSNDGNISTIYGKNDVWVLRLDKFGDLIWEKTFGGTEDDIGYYIDKAENNNYIIAGFTESSDGDVSENYGYRDAWIIKINDSGDLIWEKSFGEKYGEVAKEIHQTSDGGFIIAIETMSRDFDNDKFKGEPDAWFLKIDHEGNKLWESYYGDELDDYVYTIIPSKFGGYIAGGYSSNRGGDYPTDDYLESWLLRLNKKGEEIWISKSNTQDSESIQSIVEKSNGDIFVATGGHVNNNRGFDVRIVKHNINGKRLWYKNFGGNENEFITSLKSTYDNGLVFTGGSLSSDGHLPDNKGISDIWIAKLSDEINIVGDTSEPFTIISENTNVDSENLNSLKTFIIVKPNISENTTTLEFQTIEPGHTKLEVYNFLGSKVVTIINGDIELGRREMTIDLSDFATGRYYIQLTTPTVTKTEILEVVK